MVCELWRVARSSVYALRAVVGAAQGPNTRTPGKRGPKTELSDDELAREIRTVLSDSPFLGEGHRKVKVRLAAKGIRAGKNRVLRLMRAHGLLAPVRRGHPRGYREPQWPDPHAAAGRALGHGRGAVLDEGGGVVLVLRSRRPLRLGRRRLARRQEGRPLGGAGAAPAGRPGPQGRLQQGRRPGASVCGMTGAPSTGRGSSRPRSNGSASVRTPAYVGEPECNGVAERFIRTLKEECIHLHDVDNLEEARGVIGAFIERYNNGWLLQRHGYLTPARVRQKLSRRAA